MYKKLSVKNYLDLVKKNNLEPLTAKVITSLNYKKMKEIKLKDAFDFKNMDLTINRVKQAIAQKEKIIVYGDYDFDGISAVSIIVKTFLKLDYKVGYYIPSRYKDGYGLNKTMIDSFFKKGYQVLICVDCGIRNNEEIEYAKSLKMEVIIIDHHEPGETLPNSNYIIHPKISNFATYNMSAAALSFYFSKAILDKEDDYLLTLAGISTIADVMPLVEENYLLAKKAIENLNKNKYQNIVILTSSSEEFNEKNLSFNFIPKINAIGRISQNNEVNRLVEFFVSDDLEKITSLSRHIEQINEKRKALTREYVSKLDKGFSNENIIIIKDDTILEGICGLVATQFTNKYNVPVIVLAKSSENLYKGSCRSIEGVNIVDLLEQSKNLLNSYGGHELAAGLSLEEENFIAFKEAMEKAVLKYKKTDKVYEVIEVEKIELTYQAYLELKQFSPFGEARKEPLFLITNVGYNNFKKSKDNKHLLIDLTNEASLVEFFSNLEIKEDKYYDFIFTLDKNSFYKNRVSGIIIKSYSKTKE